MNNKEFNITLSYIKEDENVLYLDVKNVNDIEVIRKSLTINEFDNSFVKFEVVPDGFIETSYARGGEKIKPVSSGGTLGYPGTIACNAYDPSTGKYGIITCWHVLQDYPNYNVKLNGSGTVINNIANCTKHQRSGTIDAAFLPFSNSST